MNEPFLIQVNVPEPASWVLGSIGLSCILVMSRRMRFAGQIDRSDTLLGLEYIGPVEPATCRLPGPCFSPALFGHDRIEIQPQRFDVPSCHWPVGRHTGCASRVWTTGGQALGMIFDAVSSADRLQSASDDKKRSTSMKTLHSSSSRSWSRWPSVGLSKVLGETVHQDALADRRKARTRAHASRTKQPSAAWSPNSPAHSTPAMPRRGRTVHRGCPDGHAERPVDRGPRGDREALRRVVRGEPGPDDRGEDREPSLSRADAAIEEGTATITSPPRPPASPRPRETNALLGRLRQARRQVAPGQHP